MVKSPLRTSAIYGPFLHCPLRSFLAASIGYGMDGLFSAFVKLYRYVSAKTVQDEHLKDK